MECTPVMDLPEVRPGDDIAELVADRASLEPGDVLTVASTIVSKAEGRTADFADYPVSGRAREIAERLEAVTGEKKDPRFAQAILDESSEVLIEAPFLLTETRFGHICPNAGIDQSNVPDHDLLLLPKKPSESAERIRAGLEKRGLEDVAVIVTDTCGRPFRHGQRGVAIGWAGMSASRDWRGELDRDGHELGVTVQSVVDELASAANLVTGEGAGGTPAVVVRDWKFGDLEGSDELFRAVEDDLVRDALRNWRFDK
ncbi:coenzyme F420-0:L-glutamate ligase / coenzyme F420-1:gamma-L-glutamate ligase [Natronorubrum sediminis]|uniref:Coenzyme F420:L-glutamate ligase n=1 Tax=Natronorubrum sediminis TaxID=640943 RepID=A0A1H6G4P3_9EURY|nr:coenzyme F420-0:L-glutamate ligase [Natronorubrum sediminis]SEH16855.1 coenzyme F420-0:L-glutamate ligase / coenzyme F420-1:gamma-L-glutamate ligase [Natronorubrum sediminis]